jgi:hypothetical protein
MDSVVFDLRRGPGTVAQVVCSRSRASIEHRMHLSTRQTPPQTNKAWNRFPRYLDIYLFTPQMHYFHLTRWRLMLFTFN